MAGNSFNDILTAAINDFTEHGFDSAERLAYWQERLKQAAEASMTPDDVMQDMLRRVLHDIYQREVERGAIVKFHPGVERFTLAKVKPHLRAELDRRIMASANLITLNKEQAVQKTLQRFSGWATSIPVGGSDQVEKGAEKKRIKKSIASLPFEERRVLIDQSHKLNSSLSTILATDGGAIAGRWHSRYRQHGYDFRPDHKERDSQIYVVPENWALTQGLMKLSGRKYIDDLTMPAEEPFCFPGNSRVPYADGVEVAYRRWYSGDLSEIVTATGKTLRGTPNHPVLTPRGWVALGLLNEGDNVIEAAEKSWQVTEKNEDNAVTTLAEIFGAVRERGTSETVRGELEQFHGDGTKSDIDVVYATRPLTFGRVTANAQHIGQFNFSMPEIALAFVRALEFFGQRGVASGACLMRGSYEFLPSFFPFLGHPHIAGGGFSANGTPGIYDVLSDYSARNIEFPREGENALSRLMARREVGAIHVNTLSGNDLFAEIKQTHSASVPKGPYVHVEGNGDLSERIPFRTKSVRVVKVNRQPWAGHVFNLQTRDGWYVTEDIITHNCRCKYLWLYTLGQLPDEMLTEKGRSELARVRAEIRTMAAA